MRRSRSKSRAAEATISLPLMEFKKMESDISDTLQTIEALNGVVEEWRFRYSRLERDYKELRAKYEAAWETIRCMKRSV